MKKIFLVVFLLFNVFLFADSPLTSTPFYKAYSEISIIKEARVKGLLNRNMAEYLSSGSVSLDLKAALINALSWDIDGKSNSVFYKYSLCLKYGVTLDKFDTSGFNSDEVFCLAYLEAMDNYFHVGRSLILMESAMGSLNKSFTANLIYSLVKAQNMMEDQDWNSLWIMFDNLQSNGSLKRDIRPGAVKIVLEYMVLYK